MKFARQCGRNKHWHLFKKLIIKRGALVPHLHSNVSVRREGPDDVSADNNLNSVYTQVRIGEIPSPTSAA